MVLPLPVATLVRGAQCADGALHRDDLVDLLRQLSEVGPGGTSAELRSAMQRLGCPDEHQMLVMLLRLVLSDARMSDNLPQAITHGDIST